MVLKLKILPIENFSDFDLRKEHFWLKNAYMLKYERIKGMFQIKTEYILISWYKMKLRKLKVLSNVNQPVGKNN